MIVAKAKGDPEGKPRKRPPKREEKKGVQYPDSVVRAARALYVAGTLASDAEIAAELGVPRRETITNWRLDAKPDGIDWDEMKQRVSERATDEVTRALGQTTAEMNIELGRIGRASVQVAFTALHGGPFYVDLGELGVGSEGRVEVEQVYLKDGRVVRLSRAWPQSALEYARLLAEGAKQMRMAHGEASERVEVFNQAQDDLVDLLRRALILADIPEKHRNALSEALQEVFMGTPLELMGEGG